MDTPCDIDTHDLDTGDVAVPHDVDTPDGIDMRDIAVPHDVVTPHDVDLHVL